MEHPLALTARLARERPNYHLDRSHLDRGWRWSHVRAFHRARARAAGHAGHENRHNRNRLIGG
jgi:hypothetical protein